MSASSRAGLVVGAILVVLGYLSFVAGPLEERIQAAASDLAATREDLQATRELARLQGQLAPLLEASGSQEKLLTRIERRLDQLDLRERVRQMRDLPIRPNPQGETRAEEAAYLRLDNLDLRELTALLDALGKLERNVWVRKMDLRLHGQDEALVVLEVEELKTE